MMVLLKILTPELGVRQNSQMDNFSYPVSPEFQSNAHVEAVRLSSRRSPELFKFNHIRGWRWVYSF